MKDSVSIRLWLWIFLSVSMASQAIPAQTVIPEIRVSPSNIPDYEFDTGRNGTYCPECNFGEGNARFAFTDTNRQTWIGQVDYFTGAFSPADGRGVLLDSNGALPTEFGNGPEWVASTRGSEVVFTRYPVGAAPDPLTAELALSSMADGSWVTTALPDSSGRAAPAGTLDEDDESPRINYVSSSNNSKFYWRSLALPGAERDIRSRRTDAAARRWVPGSKKLVYLGQPPDSTNRLVDQVFTYDTETRERMQLTFDPATKVGVFIWRAPEYDNEYVLLTMSELRTKILIYRQLTGADGVSRWTVTKTITGPESLPYFWSPEVFVHNGKSYVFFQVSAFLAFYDRTKPNQLAMSGIDPLKQEFRMLTNDQSTPRLRLDPEYFITAQGPFIYYNRAIPQSESFPSINEGVWRVDTRLGPPSIAD